MTRALVPRELGEAMLTTASAAAYIRALPHSAMCTHQPDGNPRMTQAAFKAQFEPQVSLLLVEPDVISRTVLADYLRGCGYIVHESITAVEALEALGSELPIDIVLAEIHEIGTMTGFELAHAIRKNHPSVDVILTSSVVNTAEKCHELC